MPKENLDNKISIEYVDTNLLKPYPENPREINDKGKEDLKRSIRKFGWTSAMLINMAPGREYITLSGNQRLLCAQEMKIPKVPVVKIIVSDPDQEREIVLRMNVNNGAWSYEILKDWNIDIVLEAGLNDLDLSAIWDDSLETEDDDFDVDKAIQQIKEPKAKPGDIFVLGNHLLGCGDSTDSGFIKRLVGQTKIDMIYTDPKFNLSLSYDKGLGGKSSYGGKTDDHISDTEYKQFLSKTIANGLSVAKTDCHVFFYSDQLYIGLLQEIYHELGIQSKRVCIWVKNGINPTPQVAFNKCFEPCLYGTVGRPYVSPRLPNLSEILNKEVATGNRQIDDVLDMIDVWLVKRLAGQHYSHPTEKPVTLHEKPIRRCTKVNDVVLDLACGSGSTLISCEQLKRRCVTLDIEPIFCDLAMMRFETLTGQKPKLISGGKNGK